VVAIFFAVDAERRSLETVAAPLALCESEQPSPGMARPVL
jgi:hypothetical protein